MTEKLSSDDDDGDVDMDSDGETKQEEAKDASKNEKKFANKGSLH